MTKKNKGANAEIYVSGEWVEYSGHIEDYTCDDCDREATKAVDNGNGGLWPKCDDCAYESECESAQAWMEEPDYGWE